MHNNRSSLKHNLLHILRENSARKYHLMKFDKLISILFRWKKNRRRTKQTKKEMKNISGNMLQNKF